MLCFRALLVLGGAAVYSASRLLEPVYLVRPDILLEPVSLLIPPSASEAAVSGILVFLVAWLLESWLYRVLLGLPGKTAVAESLRSYTPVAFLLVFAVLFVPGLPGIPFVGWWLLLDASAWPLTLVGALVLHRKASLVRRRQRDQTTLRGLGGRPMATFVFGLGLLAVLVAMTPTRRFTEPYDSRWGTGDEPRYVRIAASLLHDGDADISNAAEHVGRKPESLRVLSRVVGWPGAVLSTMGEVVSSWWADSPARAVRLGGQVIRGKGGGTYYVYLPGFPLLLVPAMALDAVFFPGILPSVLLTCLLVGVMSAIVTATLVEPYLEDRLESFLLVGIASLVLPTFFYHFQLYPEMTAALCLALMLKVLFDETLGHGGALLFGLAGSLLPWLHTRYFPVLGVCLLALVYRTFLRDGGVPRGDWGRWKIAVWAIALPLASVTLQCLYIFHITGSLLPDALWVVNGYPRGGHLFNPQALSGLYYLILGREEGLLVYAPMYLLAIPGLFALWRRSRFAAASSLGIIAPYLWISASHDQGGAGGWSPTARYLVPMMPVLVLWVAAWLARPGLRRARWSALVVGAAASFWIGQGMLVERHFPYDRAAYLASGVLNVSAGLGSVVQSQEWPTRIIYPFFLVLSLAVVLLWERRGEKASLGGLSLAVVGLLLVAGVAAQTWTAPKSWVNTPSSARATRLRPDREARLELRSCGRGLPRLRFTGAEGPHALTVRGPGFERHLVVPPTGDTEIEVTVEPVRRVMRRDSEEIAIVGLELAPSQTPLLVESVCP